MFFKWNRQEKEQQALKDLQKAIRDHWPNDPIDLECLVRENWDESEDGKSRIYKYIVFVDKNLKIDWITADNSLDQYSSQVSRASVLESIPHDYLPKKQIIEFKKLIGEAIVSFFNGNSQEAENNINRARQYVMDRIIECSRK